MGLATPETNQYPRDRRVILVHGACDTGQGFHLVADLLVDLEPLSYDRRGHGAAIDRLDDATEIADHAADLLSLIGAEPAVVVGHSIGGAVALTAAAQAPDRIRAVGLYETAMPWSPWWEDSERSAMLDTIRANAARAIERHPEGDPARRSTIAAWRACELDVRSLFRGPFDWDAISVPLVAGVGTNGSVYSGRDTRRLADHLSAPLIVIEGADHTAHRTAPEGFADLVRHTVRAAAAT